MSENQDWKNKDQEDESILENEGGIPTWFNWLFISCILIAFMYGISYTFIFKNSQELEYKNEVTAHAKIQKKQTGKEVDLVANGKKTFASTCSVCHGPQAKGSVGPNLTDNVWLHGSTKKQVYNAIHDGVLRNFKQNPVKGPMPSHAYLGKNKILEIIAWLATVSPSIK